MLRRTLSLAMYLQSVGRVLRTHERKDYARVIDCVGVSLIHGYPDDEREWSLDGRPKKKRGESEREIELMRCPSCWEEHLPRKTCPACGHNYGEDEGTGRSREMQQVDAELVEVSEDQRRAEQAEKRRKIGRARTLDELKDLALELGYSKGWAYRIYEARKQKEGVTA
jgi:superfamily II DNA or RNA helicase